MAVCERRQQMSILLLMNVTVFKVRRNDYNTNRLL